MRNSIPWYGFVLIHETEQTGRVGAKSLQSWIANFENLSLQTLPVSKALLRSRELTTKHSPKFLKAACSVDLIATEHKLSKRLGVTHNDWLLIEKLFCFPFEIPYFVFGIKGNYFWSVLSPHRVNSNILLCRILLSNPWILWKDYYIKIYGISTVLDLRKLMKYILSQPRFNIICLENRYICCRDICCILKSELCIPRKTYYMRR